MNIEELRMVGMSTSIIVESTVEDFSKYLEPLPLGELLGLKNYVEAEFERVKQIKDALLLKLNPSNEVEMKEVLDGLYLALTSLETKHQVINMAIDNVPKMVMPTE